MLNLVPEAKSLSAEVKDLISRILVPCEKRISIEEILKHPWMTKQLPTTTLTLDFTKMRNFSKFSKVVISPLSSKLSS
jgi:serine/threonine protein kinase